MKVVVPAQVAYSQLVTNIPLDDTIQEWSAKSWPQDVKVRLGTDVWQANVATDNNEPSQANTQWTRIDSINPWRLFDDQVSSQSMSDAAFSSGDGHGIQIEYRPETVVNAIAVFNAFADAIRVEVVDDVSGAGVVYDKTFELVDNSAVYDIYTYFFNPIRRRRDFVITDLPQYAGVLVRISLIKEGEPARCGHLVMGQQHSVGDTLFGQAPGMKDYSRIETNDFGNTTFSKGLSAKRLKVPVKVSAQAADFVYTMLDDLRSVPAVWISNERRATGLIFGFFRSIDVAQSNPVFDDININIEGLT